MNHKKKLLEIYNISSTVNDVNLPTELLTHINTLGSKIESQKGVYTVLITLGIHKILYPKQDIRYFQVNMKNGFSGRSIDTKYITPTLKELGLTSMSESGWLTRSLEQPYPYTFDYEGKISKLKNEFLYIVDKIQNQPEYCESILRLIINYSILVRKKNKIKITPISNPDSITIEQISKAFEFYFNENYHISGGSKLPVISFHTIYQILLKEMKRFDSCILGELGSHTSSDKTSKSSGDIEIFKDNQVIESLEIKLGIEVDKHLINRVINKIIIHNPKRYYVLSTLGIKEDDYSEIITKIHNLKNEHGCQLIINGLIPTLKYYLRLINNLEEFIKLFTQKIIADKELKIIHKEKWKEIHEKEFSSS